MYFSDFILTVLSALAPTSHTASVLCNIFYYCISQNAVFLPYTCAAINQWYPGIVREEGDGWYLTIQLRSMPVVEEEEQLLLVLLQSHNICKCIITLVTVVVLCGKGETVDTRLSSSDQGSCLVVEEQWNETKGPLPSNGSVAYWNKCASHLFSAQKVTKNII